MEVWLNGQRYELDGSVRRELLPDWAEQIRTTGQRSRKDRTNISVYAKEMWDGGLGLKRPLEEKDYRRFWDADAETRFDPEITPPILAQVASINPLANLLAPIISGNEVFAVTAGSALTHYLYKYDPATNVWGSYTYIASVGPSLSVTPLGIGPREVSGVTNLVGWEATIGALVGAAVLYDLYAVGSITRRVPTNSNAAMTPPLAAKLAALPGGETHLYTVATRDGLAFGILDSKNPGQDVFVNQNPIIKGEGYIGAAVPFSPTTGSTNIYVIGANRVFVKGVGQFDLDSYDPDNGRGSFAWNGHIFIPLANDDVMTYKSQDTTDVFDFVGPGVDDGLPAARQGPWTAGASSGKWLFLGKGGNGAARNASILAYDTIGWHSIWRDATLNRTIAEMLVDTTSAVSRLHFFLAATYGLAGATIAMNLPYILSAPHTEPSLTVATLGYLTDVEFYGDTPEYEGGYFRQWVQAKGLGGLNKVTVNYGIDGASYGLATLGQVTTISDYIRFGVVGTQGRTIQFQYLLERGTLAGTYPALKFSVLEYLKKPPSREAFSLVLNIEKTARQAGIAEQGLLAHVATTINSRTLVPFHYGQIATKNVLVEAMGADDKVWEGILPTELYSKVPIRVVEF